MTIPGQKVAYRLFGKEGYALVDLLMLPGEEPPQVGVRILCRHPFSESKRAYVIPQRVEPLYHCYWSGDKYGECRIRIDLSMNEVHYASICIRLGHPHRESKRAYGVPQRVEPLYYCN